MKIVENDELYIQIDSIIPKNQDIEYQENERKQR